MIVVVSFILSYILRHNFSLNLIALTDMFHQIPLVLVAYWIGFMIFKPYSGVVRFTVTQDIFLIFNGLYLIEIARVWYHTSS